MVQTLITQIISEVCCHERCGITFGMEGEYRNQKLKDHTLFYCPNGHGQHYSAKTAVEAERDRLATQLKQTETCLTYARQDVDRLRGTVKVRDRQVAARKGIITRFKRRLVAGRCVCCSKQFKDLETHMKNQHPSFDPERGAEVLSEQPK